MNDLAAKERIAIPITQLLVGLAIPFDVYTRDGEMYSHLFRKWTHFSDPMLKNLLQLGIATVYVEGDVSRIEMYLGHKIDEASPSEEQKTFSAYSRKKQNYHQIEKTLLVDKSLFIPYSRITFSLFEVGNMAFTQVVEASVDKPVAIPPHGFGVKGDLAIRIEDIALYQEYLDAMLSSPALPAEVKRKSRAIGMKESSKIMIREVLASPTDLEKINQIAGVVGAMTEAVLNNEIDARDLMSLKNHDLYTYTHSINVTVLSVALAAALGLPREQIEKLGIGAMLHDIGKSAIPAEVLNKQGQLSEEEFRLMQQHPVEGIRMLEGNAEIPKESLLVVLQHHEKLNGAGYPLRLQGNKITAFGRISALTDCYDALTTPRPYRYSHTPYMALSLLTREAREREEFDPDCLKALVKVVADLSSE
ncbi:MAG TPA: HD-GYP domain-containing protein [Dissulfurispiraceae bacterium]|nr:HD-GYP domain-containing protein [Dissulfurispiraceae bacterium]